MEHSSYSEKNKMVGKTNIIKTKYQSNSPGSHWIKVSDANKLRDKALENQAKKIKKVLKKISKGIKQDIIDLEEVSN